MTSQPRMPLSSQLEHDQVTVDIPMSYLHLNAAEGKPLLLFFHGYMDTGAGVLRRAFPEMDSKYEILAPNGLFPVATKIEGGWKHTYAWYFMDLAQDKILMPPAASAKGIVHLLEKLNLVDRPKILLGFSQGGFFLPHIFPKLQNVQKMFGIGAAYRFKDYPAQLPVPLDAFHGVQDSVVTYESAKSTFEALKVKNPNGEFHSFEGLGHTMNAESRSLLKKKIEAVFP